MVNWLLVVGRLLIVEDQYSVYQSTGSSYTLDSWRPALGSTGAHIPRSIINHAAANAPKKLSLLDGAVTFVCNCVLARIWELLVLTSCICVYLMKLLGGQREPARWFELRYPTVCLQLTPGCNPTLPTTALSHRMWWLSAEAAPYPPPTLTSLTHTICYSVHSAVWEGRGLMILWCGRSGGSLVMYTIENILLHLNRGLPWHGGFLPP